MIKMAGGDIHTKGSWVSYATRKLTILNLDLFPPYGKPDNTVPNASNVI